MVDVRPSRQNGLPGTSVSVYTSMAMCCWNAVGDVVYGLSL